MVKLLERKEVEKRLKQLSAGWSVLDGDTLEQAFTFDSFKAALGFVTKVGELADKVDHHPEVKLSWGKAVISLTTHEVGGLTTKDFALAAKIEQLNT